MQILKLISKLRVRSFLGSVISPFVFIVGSFLELQSLAVQVDLAEFELHPDCRLELVAKEPQVVDPIAIRFDERGRMWVVEMRDYPVMKGKTPRSKIKILEDLDQDGVFEKATVFAEQLMYPTGIQPWKNGVIVTLAGQIIYLGDNDGDHICDEERILFSGFAEQNTQLRANHPTLGPDGYIYIANGLRNGSVVGGRLKKPLSIRGMDFRFDPLTLECEAVTGYGQFGMTFDDAGYRYTCTNRNPLKRIVFENQYLTLANGIQMAPAIADVAAAGPDSRLFPISETWTTSNLHANQFTAACGVHIFPGRSLGTEFQGNAFTCDPTANVVHREVISWQGESVVGTALPGRKGVEFLASRNPEFRPVNLTTGPDEALYVVDMRRTVIEHPDFMPSELKTRPDLRQGSDLGRIYRIVSKSSQSSANAATRLPSWNIESLPKRLTSENAWSRQTGFRLIRQVDTFDQDDELQAILSRRDVPPESVILSLSLLRLRNRLQPEFLTQVLSHPDWRVRRYGILVGEQVNAELPKKWLQPALFDVSPHVRFQALLTSVKLGHEVALEILASIGAEQAQDGWMRSAVMLATGERSTQLLWSLLTRIQGEAAPQIQPLLADLATVAGARGSYEEIIKLLQVAIRHVAEWKPQREQALVIADRLLAGLRTRRLLTKAQQQLESDSGRNRLLKRMNDPFTDLHHSSEALRVWVSLDPIAEYMSQMTLQEKGESYKLLFLQAAQFLKPDRVWLEMVKRFRAERQPVRAQILSAALRRPAVAKALLSSIKSGDIKAAEIDLASRKRLLAHSNAEVKRLAAKTLSIKINPDRELAMTKYRPALDLKTEPQRGRAVFERTCASCHQLGQLGNRVGPDISDTRTKTKSQLLLDILRPNAAIDNNYVQYNLSTLDGQQFSGLILEENSTSLKLQQAAVGEAAANVVIQRDNIERIASTGKSLMPVGLEQDLTLQQMADLISFLKNWRYLEKNVPFSEAKNAK